MIHHRICCRAVIVAAVFVSTLHAEDKVFDAEKAAKLIESFASGDKKTLNRAWVDLADMGPPALPQLIAALKDKNEEVRDGAAQAMAQMGAPAAPAVPDLVNALENEKNLKVIATVLWAIEQSGVRPAEAERSLAKFLENEEPELQAYSAILLAKFVGPPARKYSTKIIDNLPKCRKNVTAFGWSLSALCWLGVENADVEKLMPILVDEFTQPRTTQGEHIASLFGRIGEPALPVVTGLLASPEKAGSRLYLLHAIGFIGPSAKSQKAEILKWMADPVLKEAAEFALVATAPSDPKSKELIELAMADKRLNVLSALSYGGREGVAILEAGLGDGNQTVRDACSRALWRNLAAAECYDCILKVLRNGTRDAQQALIGQHKTEPGHWFVFDKLVNELPEAHPLRKVPETDDP
jgi:HEAT repeat protein